MKAKPYIKWIIAAAILGAIWLAWNVVYPSGSFNYRMTITVETPEGVKEASAVWKVCYHHEPKILPDQHGALYSVCQGEAIEIDLGQYGLLFAIMHGEDGSVNYSHLIILDAFPLREKTSIGSRYILTRTQYPKFIRFKDLDNITTAKVVAFDRRQPFTDLGSFGKSISLKELKVEITNDAVTSIGANYRDRIFRRGALDAWIRTLRINDPVKFGREDFVRGMP